MSKDTEAIQILREQSYRFRSLEKSHSQLEVSLQGLVKKKILNPTEELQKKTFQKKKLAAKDSMEQMMRHYLSTGGVMEAKN